MNLHIRGGVFEGLGILLCSAALLAFAFWPQLPAHSTEVASAFNKYKHEPSEKNKRAYEKAIDKANRSLHVLQYSAAFWGVALPLLLLKKKKKATCLHEP